jgi:hypothetical protein
MGGGDTAELPGRTYKDFSKERWLGKTSISICLAIGAKGNPTLPILRCQSLGHRPAECRNGLEAMGSDGTDALG